MIEWFAGLHPVMQALLAGLFTWMLTALGAGVVVFARGLNRKFLDSMLGFSAGVMIAASFWSLLAPSISMSEEMGLIPWLPPVIGFLLGAGFLRIADKIIPHLHLFKSIDEAEGIKTHWKKTVLLVLAIALHNIPEGLAVGVALGSVGVIGGASLTGAIALALGIGIQNIPEGMAVSLPIRREGLSRRKSFFWGQLSAIVEPISAVLGAAVVYIIHPILPYALAFAAGAMIFVVAEEVIPEAQAKGNNDIATTGVIIGFTVMMLLDVALG